MPNILKMESSRRGESASPGRRKAKHCRSKDPDDGVYSDFLGDLESDFDNVSKPQSIEVDLEGTFDESLGAEIKTSAVFTAGRNKEEVRRQGCKLRKSAPYGAGMLKYREYVRGQVSQNRESTANLAGLEQVENDVSKECYNDVEVKDVVFAKGLKECQVVCKKLSMEDVNHYILEDSGKTESEDSIDTVVSMSIDKLPECNVVLDSSMCTPVKKRDGTVVQGVKCTVCHKVLVSRKALNFHKRHRPECSDYTNTCNVCLRSFQTIAGLKQHKYRTDCGIDDLDRCPSAATEGSSEDPSSEGDPLLRIESEQNHNVSSQRLLAAEKHKLESLIDKDPICWPKMSEVSKWKQLDTAVKGQLLESGTVEVMINRLQTVVYEEAKNLFGARCKRVGEEGPKPNRRTRHLATLRHQIKNLTKLAKRSDTDEERGSYLLLRSELVEKKREVRRAEGKQKRRWRKKRARDRFFKDPYGVAKEILGKKVNAQLKIGKEEFDQYVSGVASDAMREVELGELEGLPEVSEPEFVFEDGKFDQKLYMQVVRKSRNKSKPGPNQVPYKVYKKCEFLRHYLFRLLEKARKAARSCQGKVPIYWRISDGVMIPKVDKPKESDVNDFRQIALMNVEGKLFWSLVGKRLYNFAVENNYIKTSSQKGSIQKVAGCWEHTSMVWAAVRDAKTKKKPLALLWLDLANAYGSVPHKLIEFALKRYKVPQIWIDLILDYYDGLWGRSSSRGTSSDWFRYERGIFAGCTISVILFLLAFNVLLDYIDRPGIQRYELYDQLIEVARGFMDDLSLLTTSVPMAKMALNRTTRVLEWARMKPKASKSRSLVLLRGHVMPVEPFFIGNEVIPSLHKKPLRTLGRVFDCYLEDVNAKESLIEKFRSSLQMIAKARLLGTMKAWVLTNMLLAQVKWDFMIYEFSITVVEELERKQNIFLRKWLGVAQNLSDVCLYSDIVPCPLPLKSLVSLFKSTKVSSFMQLMHSKDEQVRQCARPHFTGQRWDIQSELEEAEARMRLNKVVGEVRGVNRAGRETVGCKAGLGYVPFEHKEVICGSQHHRKEVVRMMKAKENEAYEAKAAGQVVQGMWLNWKEYVKRDLGWRSGLFESSSLHKFCLGATYNTLGSPENLLRMGLVSDAKCSLCGVERCGIRHILSGCSFMLGQGRYLFRHNNVLRIIADAIQSFLQRNKVISDGVKKIHFVKECDSRREKKGRKPEFGLLHKARDFQLSMDLQKLLKYPEHIAVSGKRPDIVIYSNSLKSVIHVELTCPCEERFEEAHKDKMARYGPGSPFEKACADNGWKTSCFPIEVGARGYASKSLGSCLRQLGLGKKSTRTTVKKAANEALRSSFWIWVLRDRRQWQLSTAFKRPDAESGITNLPLQQATEVVHPKQHRAKVKRKVVQQREQPTAKVSGLFNIGNTCYMNAVIQSLCFAFDFSRQFKGPVFQELATICRKIRSQCCVVSPSKFWKAFTDIQNQFQPKISYDTAEFYAYLLDSLPKFVFKDNVSGKLQSIFSCNSCQHKSISYQPFMSLSVLSRPSSIMQLMSSVLGEEQVDEYLCTHCLNLGAKRQLAVSVFPSVLVVVLKRFNLENGQTVKEKSRVLHPLENLLVNGKGYTVQSVVLHSGSVLTGHFRCITKIEDQWWLFDDHKEPIALLPVQAIEEAKDGYMFMYKCREV